MSDIKLSEAKGSTYIGTGRRKTAVARVRLASGTGKILVNGRPFENYFPLESLRATATQPLTVTGTADKFDAQITVSGGGPNGQAGNVLHRNSLRLVCAGPQPLAPLKDDGQPHDDPRLRERHNDAPPGAAQD